MRRKLPDNMEFDEKTVFFTSADPAQTESKIKLLVEGRHHRCSNELFRKK